MSSPAAQNLDAIQKAMVRHNGNCGEPLLEIRMNPFEVERLGWDELRGVPIVGDDTLPTGRFVLVCSGQHGDRDPGAVGVGVSEGASVSAAVGGGSNVRMKRPLADACRGEATWEG